MLDAAVKVFARRGFHAASMDEVAEDAGVSKPMVYAYLGTKEQLFRLLVQRESTRLITAVADAVAPDLDPDEQLWQGLRAFLGHVDVNRDSWALLSRRTRAHPTFAAEWAEIRSAMVTVVTGMLDRAVQARGGRVRDTELEVTANALVGAGESVADWMIDHPGGDPGKTATQLMNFAWVGAGRLLDGTIWHPSSEYPM
jgi:AcrR family transcriptional regulator